MNKIFRLCLILFLAAGFLAAPANVKAQTPGVIWDANIELDSPGQLAQAQATSAELTATMQKAGVQARLSGTQLRLSGHQSLEQLRAALFDTSAPWADFLGGPVELTLTLPADANSITLELETRLAAGYRWNVVSDGETRYTESAPTAFAPRHRGYGAPSIQTIHLAAARAGEPVVHLVYRRSFEPATPVHARLSLQVPAGMTEIELSHPFPAQLETDSKPQGTESDPNPLETLEAVSLPSSWDWRTAGIVPAVRNQGACGSCWAFGTVGVMESAIAKSGGPLTDLSEQFLVSCNRSGWNCYAGGLTAHKYHYDTLAYNQTIPGAVLEATKPYTATNGTCTVTYNPPYRLTGWKFINGSEWIVGTVAQIKTAIYTYGPITAGVCAGPAFDNYTGGIFTTEEATSACGGSTNHQIILVGWDDATGSWILRNSWGPYWGESGYMRIAWGTSRVGEGTSWVTWGGASLNAPAAYRPYGETYATRPTYSWSLVAGATSYNLQVHDIAGDTYPINLTVSSSSCSSATKRCSSTPTTTLSLGGNYEWRVAATNTSGTGTSSAFRAFTVASGFNSTFNDAAGATGWIQQPGGSWQSDATAFYTTGAWSKYSSASYNHRVFANFTYSARLKSTNLTNPNGLVVRGTPTFATNNDWKDGYEFLYANNGKFSVWKVVGGTRTALKPWSATSAIQRGSYNTLKVIADGGRFRFYINGHLVWSGTDATFASGQVSLLTYRGAKANRLDVDWSKLGMSEWYK